MDLSEQEILVQKDLGTSSPCVSVVIPTFNRANCLPKAIQSALAQTERDVEIIVIDDGSTDDTPRVLESFGDQIQWFRQENQGVSAARNLGIRKSRGRFIAFLDSDDEWLPTKLECQVELLNQRPEIDFVTCLGVDDPPHHIPRLGPTVYKNFLALLLTPFPSNASRFMARRSCFERYGDFNGTLCGPEDRELWLRFLSGGARLAVVQERLVKYYWSDDAISCNPNAMLSGEAEIKRLHIDTLPSFWQRRWVGSVFLARSHFSAAITYRDRGDEDRCQYHLRKSLRANPFFPRAVDRLCWFIKSLLQSHSSPRRAVYVKEPVESART